MIYVKVNGDLMVLKYSYQCKENILMQVTNRNYLKLRKIYDLCVRGNIKLGQEKLLTCVKKVVYPRLENVYYMS